MIGGRPSLFLLASPHAWPRSWCSPGCTRRVPRHGRGPRHLGDPADWAVPGPFGRLVHVSLPVLFFGPAACSRAGRESQLAMGERWASAGAAGPAGTGMNVLLVVMDTVRADRLSLYGYGRETTPNLRRFAARASVRPGQSTAPWTLPSHASMFTGLWPHQTGVSESRPLDSACPTIAEFLAGRGYLTAGFIANTYFCNSWYGLGRGFSHYEDFYNEDLVVSASETLRSSALGRGLVRLARLRAGDRMRKTAAEINRDFLDWLGGQEAGRPFFAFLNYFDAHSPYVVPGDCDRHFGRRPENPAELMVLQDWENRPKQHVPDGEATLVSDAYDDCIGYIDSQIGKLMDELEGRGLLDNTLVVITSDHGEEMGEHGLFGHGRSLYSQEVRVPLLVLAPGGSAAGRVVGEPVSLRDLPATFVEVLGRPGLAVPGDIAGSLLEARGGSGGAPALAGLLGGRPAQTGVEERHSGPRLARPHAVGRRRRQGLHPQCRRTGRALRRARRPGGAARPGGLRRLPTLGRLRDTIRSLSEEPRPR